MYIKSDMIKSSAALLYLIDGTNSDYLSETDKECLGATEGEVIDRLLAADLEHVKRWGRPITGVLYAASLYNKVLIKKIQELENLEEILGYLNT